MVFLEAADTSEYFKIGALTDKKKQKGREGEWLSGALGRWAGQDELSDSSRILIFQMIRKQACNLGLGWEWGMCFIERNRKMGLPHPKPALWGRSSALQ